MIKILGWCLFLFMYLFAYGVLARAPMEPIAGKPEAEGFRLDAVNGASISLNDFQGKFVLLNFWATWCAPCRNEMPALDNLHSRMRSNGLEVIGIHVGPSLSGVEKFLDQVPVEFTILIDQDMGLANWGVLGLPTTFLVNPEGRLIYKAVGERKWDSPAMTKFLIGLLSGHPQMVKVKPQTPSEYLLEQFKKSFGWLYESTLGQFFSKPG